MPKPFRYKGKTQWRTTARQITLTTRQPTTAKLACPREDHRFLEIMDRSIHKNKFGNWEMPLPFRASEVYMPNNRSQAVNRLNNLLRSFKRRPKLEKDYFDFMAITLERGHAVPVPNDELKPDKGVSEEKEGNAKRSGTNLVPATLWSLPPQETGTSPCCI